jgi:hypothetical protein
MRLKMIISYLILGLALTQYQNCAPSTQTLDQEFANPVSGIDSVNVGQISFPQNKVSVFKNQIVDVYGVCDQSGALISWKLLNDQDQVIERGLAECDLGIFSVELSNQWQNHCNENLKVEAYLGSKAFSQTQIEANCN